MYADSIISGVSASFLFDSTIHVSAAAMAASSLENCAYFPKALCGRAWTQDGAKVSEDRGSSKRHSSQVDVKTRTPSSCTQRRLVVPARGPRRRELASFYHQIVKNIEIERA